MDRKDDIRDDRDVEESSLPVSYESEDSSKKSADSAPESYYHDITAPPTEGEDRYYEIFEKTKHKTRGFSVAAMTLGIISVLCCCFGWVALVLGVAAIVFSVVSRVTLGYFDGMCIAGLILGIFGVVFGTSMIVMDMLIVRGVFDEYIENLPVELPAFKLIIK